MNHISHKNINERIQTFSPSFFEKKNISDVVDEKQTFSANSFKIYSSRSLIKFFLLKKEKNK